MASFARTISQEPSVDLPVKNTFVHFETLDGDTASSSRKRCRSAPPCSRGTPGTAKVSSSSENDDCRDTCCSYDDSESCSLCAGQAVETDSRATSVTACRGVDDGSDRDSRSFMADEDEDWCTCSGDVADVACNVESQATFAPLVSRVPSLQQSAHTLGDRRSTPGCGLETSLAQPVDAQGVLSAKWAVGVELFTSAEHKAASPVFFVPIAGLGRARFQLMVFAHNKRKVLTFEQAKGFGRVELKCLDDLPEAFGTVAFSLTVGSLAYDWVAHDFSQLKQRSERHVDFGALAASSSNALALVVEARIALNALPLGQRA